MVESTPDVPNGLPKNLPFPQKKKIRFNPEDHQQIIIKSQQVSEKALVFLKTIKG
jgi:hypothetical protein